jgi:hypothetical protein
MATVKDFLRFHTAAASHGNINDEERLTADSLNTFAGCFFAGSTRVTGMPTDDGERSEVYNVCRVPRGCWKANLTIASGSKKR